MAQEFTEGNIYVYGSQVYQSVNSQSDLDFIVIGPYKSTSEVRSWGDLHILNQSEASQKLVDHEISLLECFFLPTEYKIERFPLTFQLNLESLRHSCSQKASNSWVKAKKKLLVEHEPYVAQKSLFHSLRILIFANELAETNQIVSFNQHELWQQIVALDPDWALWEQTFKPKYNQLKSQFKKLTHK